MINPRAKVVDELLFAKQERLSGYVGRSSDEVANEMERVITEATDGTVYIDTVIDCRQENSSLYE